MMCVMEDYVSYVGVKPGENMGGGTYTTDVGMSPFACSDTHVVNINPNISLLNQRPNDINQPALPEIYKQLNSDEAKEEFRTFWKLVQSIEANPNAHKVDERKRLITTEPLKLSNFFRELSSSEYIFNIGEFLKMHGITLNNAILQSAELNDAQLNGADFSYEADLNNANLSNAKLQGANLEGANLGYASLNTARLIDADLTGANLYRADLKNADLNNIIITPETVFDRTFLENIKCNSIRFINVNGEETTITNQDQIRQKFIELGAHKDSISFAEAA